MNGELLYRGCAHISVLVYRVSLTYRILKYSDIFTEGYSLGLRGLQSGILRSGALQSLSTDFGAGGTLTPVWHPTGWGRTISLHAFCGWGRTHSTLGDYSVGSSRLGSYSLGAYNLTARTGAGDGRTHRFFRKT